MIVFELTKIFLYIMNLMWLCNLKIKIYIWFGTDKRKCISNIETRVKLKNRNNFFLVWSGGFKKANLSYAIKFLSLSISFSLFLYRESLYQLLVGGCLWWSTWLPPFSASWPFVFRGKAFPIIKLNSTRKKKWYLFIIHIYYERENDSIWEGYPIKHMVLKSYCVIDQFNSLGKVYLFSSAWSTCNSW